MLLGSARVVVGDARPGFGFPAEHAFEFELPQTIAAIAASQRVEVTRVVAEPVQGIVIGGLLTPLGLIQAKLARRLAPEHVLAARRLEPPLH